MTAEINSMVEKKITNTNNTNENSPKRNEYSFYDYLKRTPSVLITMLSAIIAIVTFFSKALAIISTQKELAFWRIDPAFSSFGGDSIILRATVSILYSLGLMLVSFWFSATYDAYIPYKRVEIALRSFITDTKKEIKQIKQTMQSEALSEEESNLLNSFTELSKSTKKHIRKARYRLLLNLAPIIVMLFFIFLIYFGTLSISPSTNEVFSAILITFVEIFVLWIVSRIFCAKRINKKALKQGTAIYEVIKELQDLNGIDTFPIGKLFSAGLRASMKDAIIVAIVIALFLNCSLNVIFGIALPKQPDLSDVPMRVIEIDGIRYALVYQIDEKYFLEEASIQKKHGESETEYTLTVYTNRQRVISADDISYEIYEFKNIILHP